MTSPRIEQALAVLRDITEEEGDEDVSDALASAVEAITEKKKQHLRELPIPPRVKNRIKWCEKNGGHYITGFCEYWRCERCGLDGYD